MTINNLTLDNWRDYLSKEIFSLPGDCSTVDKTVSCNIKLEEMIDQLLSLQHQQLIEQFKNMKSMKKEKNKTNKTFYYLFFLILALIILSFFWYIEKSGDCQIKAKYYGYYNDSIPLRCFKNINYLEGEK